jgi:hypothetical protein
VIAQSGKPENPPADKYVQRAVWIPYWSEQGNEHSTLHLRNALHHSALPATLDILSSAGRVLDTLPIVLNPISNQDFPLSQLVSSAAGSDRSGSIRISYKYPYEAAVQAELSLRDDQLGKGVTIVGRPSYQGSEKSAYLAVHVPTPGAYLEVAFTNPTASPATVQVSLREAAGWKSVSSISLAPSANQRVRIEADVLNDPELLGSTRVALLKAQYSVTASEIVSNAWLVDDSTGFSNTALLHDDYPKTNTLFGTQLIARSFPAADLPNGPSFDSWLVFVNVSDTNVDVSGTLYCDDGSGVKPTPISTLHLLPYSPQTISLESVLFPGAAQPRPATCSGNFQYTGAPGHVIGRFYGASQSKAYGMYVKLEPFVTRAYSEVFWSLEGDFVPLVTVTNFSDSEDTISIYTSTSGSLQKLASQKVPGQGSFTINLRDRFAALRGQAGFNTTYGGLYVSSEKPNGKVMVKQQDFSAQKLLMVPYYGNPDYITGMSINPSSFTMAEGDQADLYETTCWAYAGCINQDAGLTSSDYSIVSYLTYGGVGPFTIQAVAAGNAQITAFACCDIGGNTVDLPAPVTVSAKCFAQLKYRLVTIGGIIPTPFNHSFWWIKDFRETRWVTDAGPSGNCITDCGYLINWVMMGDVGYYQDDNSGAALAWSSDVSSAVCPAVTNLFTFAVGWNETQYSYSFPSPNSNTYSHFAANAAGFSPTPPPNAPGW